MESGSPKGAAILSKHSALFSAADLTAISERDAQRKRVIEEVEENLQKYEVPHQDFYKGTIEKKYEAGLWQEEAKPVLNAGPVIRFARPATVFCYMTRKTKNGSAACGFGIPA